MVLVTVGGLVNVSVVTTFTPPDNSRWIDVPDVALASLGSVHENVAVPVNDEETV